MGNFIVTGGIVVAVIGAVYFFTRGGGAVTPSPLSFGVVYTGGPLEGNYKNDVFNFSLQMPEGFRAQELPVDENGATSIVLQNEKGEGIQIYITPYGNDLSVVTADDVRSAIPDMQVTDEQVVQIGANHQGVAFKSDNEAFESDSREVWFVFRGNLYQISTYSRLDGLLQAMFATWKFN